MAEFSENNTTRGAETIKSADVSAEDSRSSSGWDLQSIYNGITADRINPAVESGVQAGARAASSSYVQEFFKDLNICEPTKLKDYIALTFAGAAAIYCTGKLVAQESQETKSGEAKKH
jgi:hypothetical protein